VYRFRPRTSARKEPGAAEGLLAWAGVVVHPDGSGSVPYSNQTLTADSCGLADPFKTALSVNTDDAGKVWTSRANPPGSPDNAALFPPEHEASRSDPAVLRTTKHREPNLRTKNETVILRLRNYDFAVAYYIDSSVTDQS
jgi:hypothetical protein